MMTPAQQEQHRRIVTVRAVAKYLDDKANFEARMDNPALQAICNAAAEQCLDLANLQEAQAKGELTHGDQNEH